MPYHINYYYKRFTATKKVVQHAMSGTHPTSLTHVKIVLNINQTIIKFEKLIFISSQFYKNLLEHFEK